MFTQPLVNLAVPALQFITPQARRMITNPLLARLMLSVGSVGGRCVADGGKRPFSKFSCFGNFAFGARFAKVRDRQTRNTSVIFRGRGRYKKLPISLHFSDAPQ